ncbi:MAG: class I SAM-dependent methyltransferase, partial [Bacteroidales bacterium]
FIALAGIKEGDTVLDVGSGTGVLIPYIRENNKSGLITEMDISQRMLNMARAKFHNDMNIRYLNMDIKEYNENTEYDKIILYGVLPHISNKVDSIVKLFRNNIKGGGSILIAHQHGMDKLNKTHSQGDQRISCAILPPLAELVESYKANGMNVAMVEESQEDYTILMRS